MKAFVTAPFAAQFLGPHNLRASFVLLIAVEAFCCGCCTVAVDLLLRFRGQHGTSARDSFWLIFPTDLRVR